MKIVIMGYSGSGKSTLAKHLGNHYQIPILHLDSLQFLPNWQLRPRPEMISEVEAFLQGNDEWVIDGNYSGVCLDQRLERADQIIYLNFRPWQSLYRAFKRYLKYRGKTREDMAPGCNEKFDWEFIQWILWKGRSRDQRDKYRRLSQEYEDKWLELKNQQEIDRLLKDINKLGELG